MSRESLQEKMDKHQQENYYLKQQLLSLDQKYRKLQVEYQVQQENNLKMQKLLNNVDLYINQQSNQQTFKKNDTVLVQNFKKQSQIQ